MCEGTNRPHFHNIGSLHIYDENGLSFFWMHLVALDIIVIQYSPSSIQEIHKPAFNTCKF